MTIPLMFDQEYIENSLICLISADQVPSSASSTPERVEIWNGEDIIEDLVENSEPESKYQDETSNHSSVLLHGGLHSFCTCKQLSDRAASALLSYLKVFLKVFGLCE